MNRRSFLLVAALALTGCPDGEPPHQRLWLDAREGADPFLSPEAPPRY
jgi:hypothetical protein